MNKSNYITPFGLKKLQEELTVLHVERAEVVKSVTLAASNGDRSENADYQYGKKRLREIDKRTRFLNSRINDAVVVDPLTIKSIKVQFGATVTVEDEDGNQKKYVIVGVDEINLQLNHISYKSPIGSALISKEVGDSVQIKAPKGLIEYQITEISYVKIGV